VRERGSGRLEDDDAPFGEILFDCWQVREEKRGLVFGATLGSASGEHDRQPSSPRRTSGVPRSVSAETRLSVVLP
jgi:hypothetical protein